MSFQDSDSFVCEVGIDSSDFLSSKLIAVYSVTNLVMHLHSKDLTRKSSIDERCYLVSY